MPATRPDRAKITTCCQVRLMPRPGRPGLAPPHGPEEQADRAPHRTSFTTDDADQQDHHGQDEEGVAVRVEHAEADPGRTDLIDWPLRAREQLGEDGVVEEQGGGDGQQGQAEAAQPHRGDGQHHGHAGAHHRAHQPADEEAEPEVAWPAGRR